MKVDTAQHLCPVTCCCYESFPLGKLRQHSMALLLLRLVPGCSAELEGLKRGDHLRKFQQNVERSMMWKTERIHCYFIQI